ncbi:hypothetical protein L596_023063 [Steinernema carpocapsae]|uniref:C6 domain-containing protein n=1 Tax=Steinernema carpocapsae TaxID=34508 RepID=A0A4U5MCH6_STECR|nr:hypothetical protein L596_023063 [Steinernema carpocapsae]
MPFVVVATVFFLLIRCSFACTATRPTPMPMPQVCNECVANAIDLTFDENGRKQFEMPLVTGTAADGCTTLTFVCINTLPNPADAVIIWNNGNAGTHFDLGQTTVRRTLKCNNNRQWILSADGVNSPITRAECFVGTLDEP